MSALRKSHSLLTIWLIASLLWAAGLLPGCMQMPRQGLSDGTSPFALAADWCATPASVDADSASGSSGSGKTPAGGITLCSGGLCLLHHAWAPLPQSLPAPIAPTLARHALPDHLTQPRPIASVWPAAQPRAPPVLG